MAHRRWSCLSDRWRQRSVTVIVRVINNCVGHPYCRAEMYAGRVACRQDRQKDGRHTVTLRFPLDAASVIIITMTVWGIKWSRTRLAFFSFPLTVLLDDDDLKHFHARLIYLVCNLSGSTLRSTSVRRRTATKGSSTPDAVRWGAVHCGALSCGALQHLAVCDKKRRNMPHDAVP